MIPTRSAVVVTVLAAAVVLVSGPAAADWGGGVDLCNNGRFADAAEHFRVAVMLGPEDPANAATLSRALITADLHTEARELLESLDLEEASPPWRAESSRMLARCLLAEDRPADAIAVLRARLADLRSDTVATARMKAELEALGDANGVIAVADRREAVGLGIAAIEENLSEVRAALCR